jgi:uncharacterized protein with ParB-like and HNH nuclease domain
VSFADFLIPDNYDVNDIFDRINNSGIELTSFDIFKNIKLLNVDEENNKYKMWRECFDND